VDVVMTGCESLAGRALGRGRARMTSCRFSMICSGGRPVQEMIDGEPLGENENQTAIRLPGLDWDWATPVRRSPAGAILR